MIYVLRQITCIDQEVIFPRLRHFHHCADPNVRSAFQELGDCKDLALGNAIIKPLQDLNQIVEETRSLENMVYVIQLDGSILGFLLDGVQIELVEFAKSGESTLQFPKFRQSYLLVR